MAGGEASAGGGNVWRNQAAGSRSVWRGGGNVSIINVMLNIILSISNNQYQEIINIS